MSILEYPNPFNPKTYIDYDLPITDDVKLIVYDILGKEVATLVNKKQNAGLMKLHEMHQITHREFISINLRPRQMPGLRLNHLLKQKNCC